MSGRLAGRKKAPLKDVAFFQEGPGLRTHQWATEGMKVINVTNILGDGSVDVTNTDKYIALNEFEGKYSHFAVEENDIVVASSGNTYGKVGRIRVEHLPLMMNTSVIRFHSPNKEILDDDFLYAWLRSPEFIAQVEGFVTGGAQPNFGPTHLKQMSISLPEIHIQREIAKILTAYDDLIENNRRRMALLEDAARQLYREWFVRLRFPGHEHTPITKGVPAGWERSPLSDLAEITMGQSPESKFYNEDGEGLPFHQGVTDFGTRFVSHRIYTTALNRIAEAGDILCSVRAPVGRLNITLDKIVIGRGLAALRSKTGHQSLLYQQLRAHFFKEDLIGGGAIFASVTKKEFSAQTLLEPPEQLKRAFEEVTVPCDEQLRVLHLQNQQLVAARDVLLPRLMSGEITV